MPKRGWGGPGEQLCFCSASEQDHTSAWVAGADRVCCLLKAGRSWAGSLACWGGSSLCSSVGSYLGRSVGLFLIGPGLHAKESELDPVSAKEPLARF